ncbi:hypothetical protein BDA99DRAFT_538255 [Phascolomyces articulosus]|uniref:F-box domain-containing protein n=1 Tax=Phascolomyces articulosus TaxID=60185 RepID=A0AAD5JYG2_9FUNG|nr:hypothetical protein BDA99DRAFT_538255 [Phascolomyces articulosus]
MEPIKRENVNLLYEVPFECFIVIIQQLNQQELFQCLFVCQRWRTRLIESKELWRQLNVVSDVFPDFEVDLTIAKDNRMLNMQQSSMLMPAISDYVESLIIQGPTFQNNDEFFKSFSKWKMTSIRSLRLTVPYPIANVSMVKISSYSQIVASNLNDSIYTALQHIAPTLTELSIMDLYGIQLSLDNILTSCKNLKKLQVHVSKLHDAYDEHGPVSLSHPTQLKYLNLDFNNRNSMVPLDKIEPLIRYSPDLRILCLSHCHAAFGILPTLQGHCPKLTKLSINKINFVLKDYAYLHPKDEEDLPSQIVKKNSNPTTDEDNNAIGLRHLHLNHIYQSKLINPLKEWIEESRDTLEYLFITPTPRPAMPPDQLALLPRDDWIYPFSNITLFSRLATLSIQDTVASLHDTIVALIKACPPQLRYFILAASHGRSILQRGILQAMGLRLTHLSSLTLFNYLIEEGAKHILTDFFSHYVKMGSASPLKELHLRDLFNVDLQSFVQVAKIESLETLSMGRYTSFVTPYSEDETSCTYIHLWATHLVQLPHLTHLTLDRMTLCDNDAEVLATCPKLQKLRLITTRSRVFPLSTQLSTDSLSLLEKKIPDFSEKVINNY